MLGSNGNGTVRLLGQAVAQAKQSCFGPDKLLGVELVVEVS